MMIHNGFDSADLCKTYDNKQNALGFFRKTAAAIKKRRAAVYMFHDIAAYCFRLRRNDDNGFFTI